MNYYRMVILGVSIFLLALVSGAMFFALGIAAAETELTTIWYVKADAAGNNDGSSWADAFTDLQAALAVAQPNDEIWVAAGLYKPTDDETDREATFHLLDGVAIYGGFAGHETNSSERDWENNVTILSGDIDNNDLTDPNGIVTDTDNIVGGNSYHVIVGSEVTTTTVLDGFTITGGQANSSTYIPPCGQFCGGGIYNVDSNPTLVNLSLIGNYAWFQGGGMYNYNSNPQMANLSFDNNSANRGAGVFNDNSSPSLDNVYFNGNITRSAGQGAGMANINNSSPTLNNVQFIGNGGNGTNVGGGIYASESNLNLIDVSFFNNVAAYGGGLYATQGNTTLSGVFFSDNYANFGGGIYNRSTLALVDSTLDGNIALSGAGIYQTQSSSTLTNVSFNHNHAIDFGGGMISGGNSNTLLINVSFAGNSAAVAGGGGLIITSNSNSWLTNVSFNGNSAGTDGGGMFNVNSNSTLTNVSFSGNYAGTNGGAIFNNEMNGSLSIRNSILWNNQDSSGVGTTTASIYNENAIPTISYSLIQSSNGSGDDWNSDLGIDLGNNLDADPLFIDPPDPANAPTTEGNARLQIGSPAINAGNNEYVAGVDTDLDGNPRIIGDYVDLGAYEAIYEASTIIVNIVGQGAVIREPEQPVYNYGDLITITAAADPGWQFAGWSGDLSGDNNPTTLLIDSDKAITATFSQEQYTVTVNIIGQGNVVIEPEQATYVYGDLITVTAVAGPNWSFIGWSGGLAGDDNPTSLLINGHKTITATFKQTNYNLYLPSILK